MKLSWLSAEVVRTARETMLARASDWEAWFRPQFRPPPPPAGISADEWPRIAEHVARAERVSSSVRDRGLRETVAAFGDSEHAIEVATVAAAAGEANALGLEILELLFSCEIDDYVAYGTFLEFLIHTSDDDPERAIAIYERFCDAVLAARSDHPMWRQRTDVVRDGLAGLYVKCGRHEAAEALYEKRHDEETGDLVVALTASRAFLAHGALARAIAWLGAGADRARALGRRQMETRLRKKQDNLRARMS